MEYRILFDSMCPGWSTNPEETLEYLKSIESVLNAKFYDDGYLYLKNALNIMGMTCPFDEGIGWWYEVGNPPWDVENYISLGIYDEKRKLNRLFVNGLETRCFLTFNCMGNLTDYMLDQAIYIGGPELAQDFFDYPWLHHNGLSEGGTRWEDARW